MSNSKRIKKITAALKAILFWEDIQERFDQSEASTNEKFRPIRIEPWKDIMSFIISFWLSKKRVSGNELIFWTHNSDWLIQLLTNQSEVV